MLENMFNTFSRRPFLGIFPMKISLYFLDNLEKFTWTLQDC